ncbi:MAG TPA: archaemetzincin [Planctomycetota bacterium]
MKRLLLSLAAVAATVLAQDAAPAPAPAPAPAQPPGLAALRESAQTLRPLMQAKTPPGAGDWLAEHEEEGQTFDQYAASRPNRPTAKRTTLYIQPIGDFTKAQQQLVKDTAELMGVVFGVPVKMLDPLADAAIPESARRTHWGKKQFLSTYILDEVLLPRRPADAVAVLALTATDLFPEPSWNFVFGQASLRGRVGVWSLARYGDPERERATVLRRTLQVATHETGHMFGIQHCTMHECGMNGSNSLPESDRAPLAFCSECELKLWWACRLDPLPRYQKLAEFAQRNGLANEEAEWRRRLEALGKK